MLGGTAKVRALMMPPHMPMQCAPPMRPNTRAASSGGRSSPVGFMAGALGREAARPCFSLGALFGRQVVFVVIEQDAVGRAFQVFELVVLYRPEEGPDREAEQDQR